MPTLRKSGETRATVVRRLRRSQNGRDAVDILRNRLEAAPLITKVVEVRVRNQRRPVLRRDLEGGHDPVRVAVRQLALRIELGYWQVAEGSILDSSCTKADQASSRTI